MESSFSKLSILWLITLFLVIEVGGGLFLFPPQVPSGLTATVVAPIEDQTATSTPSPISIKPKNQGINTYSDTDFGYEFDYSSSYFVLTEGKDDLDPGLMPVGVIIRKIPDITTEPVADGACGGISPERLQFEKDFINGSTTASSTDFINTFTVTGTQKIFTSKTGTKMLLTIDTCQGIADPKDPANNLQFEAHLYNGNQEVGLTFLYPFNKDNKILVQDLNSVGEQLFAGKYKGPEQAYITAFLKILTSIRLTN